MHDTPLQGKRIVASYLHPLEQVAVTVRACLPECTMHCSSKQYEVNREEDFPNALKVECK